MAATGPLLPFPLPTKKWVGGFDSQPRAVPTIAKRPAP